MKRLLLLLPVVLTVALTAGCSKDIKVTSDVGEISVVKDSSVSTYPFDKAGARSKNAVSTDRYKDYFNDCLGDLDFEYCDNGWGEMIRENEEKLEIMNAMPEEITIVKYRTVDTNVNGDKAASDYKYVSCIPDGTVEERAKWASLISKYGRFIDNNVLDDGLVTSSVQIKVCEKYGNI